MLLGSTFGSKVGVGGNDDTMPSKSPFGSNWIDVTYWFGGAVQRRAISRKHWAMNALKNSRMSVFELSSAATEPI